MSRAQNVKVYGFASMLISPLVVPGLMVLTSVGVLMAAWGLRLWALGGLDGPVRPLILALCTALVMLSALGMGALGWKTFKHNRSTHSVASSGKGWLLGPHVVMTIVGAHVSMLLFLWFGNREFTWVTWILGTIFFGVTWLIRRFARESSAMHESVDEGGSMGLPGTTPFLTGD